MEGFGKSRIAGFGSGGLFMFGIVSARYGPEELNGFVGVISVVSHKFNHIKSPAPPALPSIPVAP